MIRTLPLGSSKSAPGQQLGGICLAGKAKVLIIDDDPSHLEIYAMLIRQAGLEPVTALVRFMGLDLPREEDIGMVLLDYKLHSLKSSADIAQDVRNLYPSAPIVVLSDMWSLPKDIEPYVSDFVRKGQPALLLDTVCRLVPCAERRTAGQSRA